MAFPAIVNTATTEITANGTDPVINLPTGILRGHLLVALVRRTAAGSSSWPAGWVALLSSTTDASNDDTQIFYKIADGDEGSTFTITNATSGRTAAIVYLVSGHDSKHHPPEIATEVTGTSTTPDPGSLSPTGGARDYLWLWLGGWEGEQTSPPAGAPTNYSSTLGASTGTAGGVTGNCRVASASRTVNAASEDPASWTISASDDWTATVMAIYPAFVGIQPDLLFGPVARWNAAAARRM